MPTGPQPPTAGTTYYRLSILLVAPHACSESHPTAVLRLVLRDSSWFDMGHDSTAIIIVRSIYAVLVPWMPLCCCGLCVYGSQNGVTLCPWVCGGPTHNRNTSAH